MRALTLCQQEGCHGLLCIAYQFEWVQLSQKAGMLVCPLSRHHQWSHATGALVAAYSIQIHKCLPAQRFQSLSCNSAVFNTMTKETAPGQPVMYAKNDGHAMLSAVCAVGVGNRAVIAAPLTSSCKTLKRFILMPDNCETKYYAYHVSEAGRTSSTCQQLASPVAANSLTMLLKRVSTRLLSLFASGMTCSLWVIQMLPFWDATVFPKCSGCTH